MIKIQKLHCDFPQFTDLVDAYLPSSVLIPLKDADGKMCSSRLKENMRVSEGEILAQNSLSSPAIHATVPGIITGFRTVSTPDGKKAEAAVIRTDGKFSYLGKTHTRNDWKRYSQADLFSLLYDKGMLNTFDKPRSLSQMLKKFSEAGEQNNEPVLAVRLFDFDPTVRTGEFLASRKMEQIIEGASIIAYSVSISRIVFIVSSDEDMLKLAEEKTAAYFKENQEGSVLKAATNMYPSGGYREIKQLLKKNRISFDALFAIDAETAFITYEAAVLNKPVLEKYVQFSGSPLVSERMFRVRIGTPIRNLVEECGGFRQSVYKIVINGLLKGTAVSDLDTPITADLLSVTFLPKAIVPFQKQVNCIRCGDCYRVCPKKIHADKLFSHYYYHTDVDERILKKASDCTGCGVCDTSCPARLPLAQTISLLKGGKK